MVTPSDQQNEQDKKEDSKQDNTGDLSFHKDFRRVAEQALAWADDYLSSGYRGPVNPGFDLGSVSRRLAMAAPEQGETLDTIMEDFKSTILPGLVHWNDPRFVGYFPCSNSKPSVLAELLAATLNVNAMSWISSPAATELELRVMRWMGDLIGLDWPGVTQDTASSGSFVALLAAREDKYPVNTKGFAEAPELVVYASDEAHSSILKGARMAGLGEAGYRAVPVKQDRSMDLQALAAMIQSDQAAGRVPCCVVATVGTTSSTAVDDVTEICRISKAAGAWVHVDAALAGSAAILPECRWIMAGVEEADSFLFNPHKWLFTNFACSAFYSKHPEKIKKAMAINPEYLKAKFDETAENLRDWSVPLGREFRSLKLWFVIRAYGVEGLQLMLREHLAMANYFAKKVADSTVLQLFAPPRLNTVCFALDSDTKTDTLLARLNESGDLFLTHTKMNGRLWLRVAYGQTLGKLSDVDAHFDKIEGLAKGIV